VWYFDRAKLKSRRIWIAFSGCNIRLLALSKLKFAFWQPRSENEEVHFVGSRKQKVGKK